MKKLQKLGKKLSKDEQKKVKGGDMGTVCCTGCNQTICGSSSQCEGDPDNRFIQCGQTVYWCCPQ